jgi:iron complex transport system substrate-binding protein
MTVQRGFALVILTLLAALLLGGPSTAAQSGIQVGVIVQGPEGDPQTFCVTLDGENPTGADALRATGLDIVTEIGGMGETVCRLDGLGCTPPGDLCFCQCVGGGEACAYWSYFHLTTKGTWAYSPVGPALYPVTQGAVEGWWWRVSGNSDAPRLPIMTFDEICGAAPPAFPRTLIDGLGREITLDEPPQRIVSATLGSDEILYALVGPERLLGVTFFADDPMISNIAGQAGEIEHTDISGSPEQMISLDADLVVLASYSNPAALDQLIEAGVPVLVLTEFNSLDEIRANIRLLGQATGEEVRAEALIAEMDARLETVRETVQDQTPPRVLYYEFGGVTYGPGSTVDEIITLAGGENVIAETDLGPYPLIDSEFILATDPDVILLGGWFSETGDPVESFSEDPAFATLRAVQNGRVYPINDAHLTNVSHYIADGVEDVARALYPDLFSADE